jgi:pilus assembly protein CpaB
MSRVSGCLWLVVALILALVAGGAAWVTLQRATVTRAEEIPNGNGAQVLVAAHPVAIGAVLEEGDLTLQTLSATALPAGALKAVSEARGQITTVPLNTGEMVLTHHLTKPDLKRDNLAFTLPEGLLAVTLSADDLYSRLQTIQPGDRVDLLYTLKMTTLTEGERNYTFGTLQGITVVSAIRGVGETPSSSGAPSKSMPSVGTQLAYVLALEPQDALALKFLKDSGAILDLAIRNVADESDHQTKAVDLQYMIDKYQLPVR